jgi:hypothetical protein
MSARVNQSAHDIPWLPIEVVALLDNPALRQRGLTIRMGLQSGTLLPAAMGRIKVHTLQLKRGGGQDDGSCAIPPEIMLAQYLQVLWIRAVQARDRFKLRPIVWPLIWSEAQLASGNTRPIDVTITQGVCVHLAGQQNPIGQMVDALVQDALGVLKYEIHVKPRIAHESLVDGRKVYTYTDGQAVNIEGFGTGMPEEPYVPEWAQQIDWDNVVVVDR